MTSAGQRRRDPRSVQSSDGSFYVAQVGVIATLTRRYSLVPHWTVPALR